MSQDTFVLIQKGPKEAIVIKNGTVATKSISFILPILMLAPSGTDQYMVTLDKGSGKRRLAIINVRNGQGNTVRQWDL